MTWDEPEGGIDELIEELWAINGEPFEVTHEEFHRVNLLVYQPEEIAEARPTTGSRLTRGRAGRRALDPDSDAGSVAGSRRGEEGRNRLARAEADRPVRGGRGPRWRDRCPRLW